MIDKNKQKQDLRKAINHLDQDLIDLLAKRLKLVRQIADCNDKGQIEDKKRESEIMQKAQHKASAYKLNKKFIKDIFELIFIESKSQQKKLQK